MKLLRQPYSILLGTGVTLLGFLLPATSLLVSSSESPSEQTMDVTNLEPIWDKTKVCTNPHKGWYIHYFDNGLEGYGDRLGPYDYLEDFPGLTGIYLRLAWSYLEPEEGSFRWNLIDREIERWTRRGYSVAFRITCKETHEPVYATPRWVEEAGAQGNLIEADERMSWEPDYGDPVFLSKLENFHRAFAARYAGKSWLEYIDVGSYGDWGEGHTVLGSGKVWPVEVIRQHIDLYRTVYPETTILISDDFYGSRDPLDGSRQEILDYILINGLGLRDDSISVKWFADNFGFSTLRNPELFELFWRTRPVNLELEHYATTKEEGTWKDGAPFARAVEEAHATYIGFHGYPREWLSENRDYAGRVANRSGYWYFPKMIRLPRPFRRGESSPVELVWENHGVAPCYHRYALVLRLQNPSTGYSLTLPLTNSDNRNWMPGSISGERHLIRIPADTPAGAYQVQIGMYEQIGATRRMIDLGLTNRVRTMDGYFTVSEAEVR